MKKKQFQTTNKLEFFVNEKSLMKGFAAFKIGTINGHFQENTLCIDFILADISDKEHLTDAIEWFSEMGRQTKKVVRAIGVNNHKVAEELIQSHGFQQATINSLVKI